MLVKWNHGGGRVERRMPLTRYFCFVGGILLALLLISDAFFRNYRLRTALIRFRTSSAFTPIGNGRSALSTTPASRPSPLRRSRAWRKAPQPRQRSRLPRRGNGRHLRNCNHLMPTSYNHPIQESENRN